MDKYEELEKILKMKENGIINEEEYQKLKSSIIFNEGSNKRVNQSNPIMIFKIIGIVIGLIGILAFFLPYISNPQSSSYYSSQESVIINGIKITDTAFQSISEFFSYIIESNSYELTGDIVFMVIINIITMLAPLVFLIIHIILLISSIIMRRKKDLTPICIINFITFIVYLVISIVRGSFFKLSIVDILNIHMDTF